MGDDTVRPNGGCGDLRRGDEGNKEGEVPALWDLGLLIKALEVNELLISGSETVLVILLPPYTIRSSCCVWKDIIP